MMILYVAAGGAIGASLRYIVSDKITALLGHGFPYGTITVNILGSLLLGIMVESSARLTIPMPQEMRALLAVGILGGFTTFSTFSLDAVTLLERGQIVPMLCYIVVSVVIGVLAMIAGMYAMRWVL